MQVDEVMSFCLRLPCVVALLSFFVVFVCFWTGLSQVFDLVR